MNSKKLIAILILLGLQPGAFAATEYVRLTGTIDEEFLVHLFPPGLLDGQFVYFDFAFDTEIDPDILGDAEHFEEFQVTTHGGNFPVNSVVGWTGFDASGYLYRSIYLEGPLDIEERIDCNFDEAPPRCSNLFDFDWEVGSTANLMLDGFWEIALLEVTYRGAEPPPPIPLPASIWFLLSAVTGLFGLRVCKRKQSD